MKRALILAAGAGKRLGDLTKDIPKCLLPLDYGDVLIDFSLEALKEIGVSEVVIVSGLAENGLRDYIKTKWSEQLSFKFIFNDKYKEYNNIYSAYLAREIWDNETILLNSDIIFNPDILKNLVETGRDQSLLVIDDKKQLTDESMKVIINSKGEIKAINKKLDIKKSFGEYIGITYLRGHERVKFLESLDRNVNNKQFDLYYEDALAHVLDEASVFPCSTQGKIWTEVDTKEDYEVAKKIAKEIKAVTIK